MRRIGVILLSLLIAAPALAQNSPDARPQAAPKAKAAAAKATQGKAQSSAKPKGKTKAKTTAAPKAASPPAAKSRGAAKAKTPKTNAVTAAYAAMPIAERVAIQNDLIWTGDYNGIANGEVGDRAVAAARSFQRTSGSKETGILSPGERAALAAAAKAKQEEVGWRLVTDAETGVRLGLPAKLVPQSSRIKDGTRWSSAHGDVLVETFRHSGPGSALADIFERYKKEPSNRQVGYSVLRPDFFVISGLQGLKHFYTRAQIREAEVRGFTILYDQAMQGIMEPVVVATSSTFGPFPSGVLAGPRKVEYGSAVAVDNLGHLITDRAIVDGCFAIMLTDIGRAERIADDETAGLALLRVYGVRKISPLVVAESGKDITTATLIGIPEPQVQNGAADRGTALAQIAGGEENLRGLQPVPPTGFAGAAAVDQQGRLVGMALIKTPVVAGPATVPSRGQFVPIETIKAFLQGHGVAPATFGAASMTAAKAAVTRVICVRK